MKCLKLALKGIGYIIISIPGEDARICFKQYKKEVDKINE